MSKSNGAESAEKVLMEIGRFVGELMPPTPEQMGEGLSGTALPLVRYPDKRLRTKCEPVEAFDTELIKLVSDMAATLYAQKGAGLAAPQIGVLKRVFVVDILASADSLPEGTPKSQLLVAINPELFPVPGSTSRSIEKCLSFPQVAEHVTRPAKVILKAFDPRGKPYAMGLGGLLGRVVQHEFDHLEGRVLLDHLGFMALRLAKKQLRKTIALRPTR